MNGATLQAIRRLLFFTQPEAAALIGNVTERSWRYWEEDRRTIPSDVIRQIQTLSAWRAEALATAKNSIADMMKEIPEDAECAPAVLVWYGTIENWMTLPGRVPEVWRPHCSVIAELCLTMGAVAVEFNGPAYSKWLNDRDDSEALRGAWAAQEIP